MTVIKILESKDIYKSFYSKLFIDHTNPTYITLLSKIYLTEDGTIYLEGQNLENKFILNTLEDQRVILQNNLKTWESFKTKYPDNFKKALEFLTDKLDFLDILEVNLPSKFSI